MEKLKELKHDQKVLIEAIVKISPKSSYFYDIELDNNNNNKLSITKDLELFHKDNKPLVIYDFNEVMNQGFTPEIGRTYEFSSLGHEWFKGQFHGYKVWIDEKSKNIFNFIRPIQIDPKEAEAIEYLKSIGYKNISK